MNSLSPFMEKREEIDPDNEEETPFLGDEGFFWHSEVFDEEPSLQEVDDIRLV